MALGFSAPWRQVTASLVLMAVSAMVISAYSVVAVPLDAEFRPSRMVLMLAMTAQSLVAMLISPMVGNLMDRVSMRALMAVGTGFIVAGFLALSLTTSIEQVLVVYGLLMAPGGVLLGSMAATVLLSRWFDARRGMALGIAMTGIGLGGLLFPPLIQALLDSFPWREAFRLLALIVLVCAVPAVLLVRDRPIEERSPAQANAAGATTAAPAPPAPLTTAAILRDPSFWLLAAVLAVILSGMKGTITNLVPLALDEGIGSSEAALLISLISATGLLAKLVFASLADRLNPRYFIAISLAGFAAGMVCLVQAESGYVVIAIGVAVIGLLAGWTVPLQGLLLPLVFGKAVIGKVAGLLNLFVFAAALASPPLFGLIFDMTGDYDAVFLLFAALAAAMLLAVPSIRLHPLLADGDAASGLAPPARA